MVLEERLHESKLPTRPLANRPPLYPEEESRNPIDSGPVRSPFEKFDDIRRALSSLFASFPSSDSSAKSLRITRPNCVSNPPQSPPFKKHPKLISSVSSKIPTCAPSTPSVSRSCQRTFNWPVAFEENAHERPSIPLIFSNEKTERTLLPQNNIMIVLSDT